MIRDACAADAPRIAEIYRHYVENTCISFELTAPGDAEMRERILAVSRAYPYLVLEEAGTVTGYAYASAFKARAAYRHTVELSVYVDQTLLGGGRGRTLITALLERLRADGRYFTATACITSPNERSERMFQKLGFTQAACYKNVGYKSGRWRDVRDYVLALKPYTTPKGGSTPMDNKKTAVVTVLGCDRTGIIARVSGVLYQADINILDISQTVVSGMFNMIMIVDISQPDLDFSRVNTALNALGAELGIQIRIQRSEIFEAMHQI